jgi:3-oxoadipate enol-lactonase
MTELLFLPALGQDEHAYDLLQLEGRAFLYPGHGTRALSALELWEIADEIADTVSEPVDLVGVALGGIIGQYLLIRHPQKFRSAVLANTPSGVGNPAMLIERADEAESSGVASMSNSLVDRWFRPSTIAAGAPGVGYIRDQLGSITSEGFAQMQRAMARTDTAALLPQVQVPVTLVQGADDPVGSGSVAKIHSLLQDSRLLEIPGSHMVHLDNPQGFREVVLDHLRWVERTDFRRAEEDD